MKKKITLVLAMLLTLFTQAQLMAQSVSGTAGTTGCLNGGTITAENDASWAQAQYQLWKGTEVIAPVLGDATQFTDEPLFVGLATGAYTLKGRDGNGGTVYTSSLINVADGYISMKATSPIERVDCIGGTKALSVTVNGGKPGYRFSIAKQSDPDVSLEDSGLLNQNSFSFMALPVGSYLVSVTDDCGQTITAATSISNPTVTVNDLKLGSNAFPIHQVFNDCSTPLLIFNEMAFRYVANNTIISSTDATLFTWKIKYKGQIYGADVDGDGYGDLNAPGVSPLVQKLRMPVTADRKGIFEDINNMRIVLYDKCGNTKEFPIVHWVLGGLMRTSNCNGVGTLKIYANMLACYPMDITFTNINNPTDVISTTLTKNETVTVC